jgi:TPR repeat protein
LGLCYANAEGTRTNYTKASYWWHRAAYGGSREGDFYCGISDRNNHHYARAFKWLLLAATARGPDREYKLSAEIAVAKLYERGQGVAKSLEKADYWLTKAVRAGSVKAKQDRRKLDMYGSF